METCISFDGGCKVGRTGMKKKLKTDSGCLSVSHNCDSDWLKFWKKKCGSRFLYTSDIKNP
jgi:hypothetical protein